MTMESLKGLGQGGAGIPDRLPKALKELQGLTFTVVTGATATTAITLTGITAKDTVCAVINLTDNAQVTEMPTLGAGTITFPTANTATKQLMVVWFNKA